MKKSPIIVLLFLCLNLNYGLAIQQASSQDAVPPDVQAWNQISSTVDPASRSQMALRFIENYPDSDLIFSVHHLLALYYLGTNNQDAFLKHGEKAIEGLPNLPDILVHLAFIYAENDQPDLAVKRAVTALQLVKNLPDPDEEAAIDWYAQLERLEGEANYALGRAYLTYSQQSEERREMNLTRSVGYLQNALQHDPRHAYASLRLGHAYSNLNRAVGAIRAYARAVAIGGRTAEPARQELTRLLAIIQEAAPESSWKDETVEGIIQSAEEELSEAERLQREAIAEKASRLAAFGS